MSSGVWSKGLAIRLKFGGKGRRKVKMDKPRIVKFPEDDEDDDFASFSGGLYSNLTLIPTPKSARMDKSVWHREESASGSSGAFGRLLRTTACRKPEKYRYGCQEVHKVELNLHQFQSESGDSLGEDPDSWARLTF